MKNPETIVVYRNGASFNWRYYCSSTDLIEDRSIPDSLGWSLSRAVEYVEKLHPTAYVTKIMNAIGSF